MKRVYGGALHVQGDQDKNGKLMSKMGCFEGITTIFVIGMMSCLHSWGLTILHQNVHDSPDQLHCKSLTLL